MTKIESVEEFKAITQSGFGFIVITNEAEKTIHQANCASMNDEFTKAGNAFHWFATISLAQKSFKTATCLACKPE